MHFNTYLTLAIFCPHWSLIARNILRCYIFIYHSQYFSVLHFSCTYHSMCYDTFLILSMSHEWAYVKLESEEFRPLLEIIEIATASATRWRHRNSDTSALGERENTSALHFWYRCSLRTRVPVPQRYACLRWNTLQTIWFKQYQIPPVEKSTSTEFFPGGRGRMIQNVIYRIKILII